MVQSCDVNDLAWKHASELRKNELREWCRQENLDPNNIYKVAVAYEGVVEVCCYRLNDSGERYRDPKTNEPAVADPFMHECKTPPPFIMW